MRVNATIWLLDFTSSQDTLTGIRSKIIVKITKLLGEIGAVGANTYWDATAANVRLDMSLIVRTVSYRNQKFAFVRGELYEIFNVAKADDPVNTRLNCVVSKRSDLKEAVMSALATD